MKTFYRHKVSVMECQSCKDKIYSRYPGEFVQCKCGQCYVDQKYPYERYSGPLKFIKNKVVRYEVKPRNWAVKLLELSSMEIPE